MNAEQILKERIEDVQGRINPGQVLDPELITEIITKIIEFIRGCRDQAKAKEHLTKSTIVSKWTARQVLDSAGYPFVGRRKMASELADEGLKLSDTEADLIVDAANDLPAPTPFGGGGWPAWCVLIAAMVLCFGSTAQASWPTTSPVWPTATSIDVDTKVAKPVISNAIASTPAAAAKLQIPAARQWTYSGDNGTREAMIKHLVEHSNHRIDPTWLAGLSYSELKALHSADHEGILNDEVRRPPTAGKVIAATPVVARSINPGTTTPSNAKRTVVRSGLFGQRVRYVYPTAASGGCPNGRCPGR